MLVYYGQTAGRIKMKLGMQVGLGHIVLDSDLAPPPPTKKKWHSPRFSAHVYCGQTAGWITFGTEVGLVLGPGDIGVRWGPAAPKTGHARQFSAHIYCGQTVAHLSYC